MRVRPFFWGLFVFVCLGILAWVAIVPRQVPAQLSIHLMQKPSASTPTLLLVEVTDAQGVPIDDAQIASQAWMTNMPMGTPPIFTTPEGQGTYLVQVSLSMAGPWMIAISMQAHGVTPLHQTLSVQVSSMSLPGPVRQGTVQPPVQAGGKSWACSHILHHRA